MITCLGPEDVSVGEKSQLVLSHKSIAHAIPLLDFKSAHRVCNEEKVRIKATGRLRKIVHQLFEIIEPEQP